MTIGYSKTERDIDRENYRFAMDKYKTVESLLTDALERLETMHDIDKISDFEDTLFSVNEAMSYMNISRRNVRKEYAEKWPRDIDAYVPDYNESAEASSHLGSMGIG